jgi:3-dehydroquinate synthase
MDITITSCGSQSRIVTGEVASLSDFADAGKSVLVTDPEIRRLHGALFQNWRIVEVPRGEAAKCLGELESLYGRFLELELDRDASIVALGGGSVSDLTGFAASTYLRGLDFGFIPTTLLAMVDASVGGKNGVDFKGLKNQIGVFRQPRFVLMDVHLLRTLSDLEFQSGMAEVIKHAVLAGAEYYELVAALHPRRASDVGDGDLARIVEGSVRHKAAVVGRDERESGERRLLNLGHTVGHAVEAVTGIRHGHAVAAGLGTICRFAERSGDIDKAEAARIIDLLSACALPASIAEAARLAGIEDSPDFRARCVEALRADKKRLGSDILLAIPTAVGKVRIESRPLSDVASFIMEAP